MTENAVLQHVSDSILLFSLCSQTSPTRQLLSLSFPSCQVSPWSCPGRVPATTEAKLCKATSWRSNKRVWTRLRAGLKWQAVVKTPHTTSARAWTLWDSTASVSEPTIRQGSASQVGSLCVSRWPLQVSHYFNDCKEDVKVFCCLLGRRSLFIICVCVKQKRRKSMGHTSQ